jgi:hypothetical protein
MPQAMKPGGASGDGIGLEDLGRGLEDQVQAT